jgi:hypothetical protein
MKKWALIVFISFGIFVMICFPGTYDSRAMAVAWGHYHDAPSDKTRQEIQDARRSDHWHIFVCELVFGAIRVWPVIALIQTSKRTS